MRGGSHFCESPKGGGSEVFLLKRKGGPTIFWGKNAKIPQPSPPQEKTYLPLAFRFCFILACALDPVSISSSFTIPDQRFLASSSRSGSNPSDGRLKGSSAWIPGSNSNSNDYLQIELGSVYFVCGVATQGNPNADDWTKTYKIATSLDNVNWKMYAEDNVEKVHMHLCRLFHTLEQRLRNSTCNAKKKTCRRHIDGKAACRGCVILNNTAK